MVVKISINVGDWIVDNDGKVDYISEIERLDEKYVYFKYGSKNMKMVRDDLEVVGVLHHHSVWG